MVKWGWKVRENVRGEPKADEEVRVESELTMYFGGVGAALTSYDGRLEAVADPRRDGVTRVVDAARPPADPAA